MNKITPPPYPIPVFNLDEQGVVHFLGKLTHKNGEFSWEDYLDADKNQDGLPWFIYDARPKGFLGRFFSKAHPHLNLPKNPDDWTDKEIIAALKQPDGSLPGNLIVGQLALDFWVQKTWTAPVVESIDTAYREQLKLIQEMISTKSGVGGEQPKFTAHFKVNDVEKHVLVKFSPEINTEKDRRIADLLVAEDIANTVLKKHGFSCANTRIGQLDNRFYLESERFDRTPTGRVATFSLEAYAMEYGGHSQSWFEQAKVHVDPIKTQLQQLALFAVAMGNTDTHFGNISLQYKGDQWELSPVYDMTPMAFRNPDTTYTPIWPKDSTQEQQELALQWAAEYAIAINNSPLISTEFKQHYAHLAIDINERLQYNKGIDLLR